MKGRIETACFHCSGGREMIYASNREAEWLDYVMDVRTCYDKLFDKTSGTSIVLLSPVKTGIMLVVSKMIPNRFGDNLTAYLNIPYGMDIPGESLQGIIFDVISALAQNRKDVVSSCLGSVSKAEYDILIEQKPDINTCNNSAYRIVNSGNGSGSLVNVLNNLFQDYYFQYQYTFLAIDDQYVANKDQHTDLTNYPINNWRPVKEQVVKENIKEEDTATSVSEHDEDTQHVNNSQPIEITSEWLKANTEIHGWLSFFFFAIIVGGLISAIYPIATFNAADYAGNFCLGAVDIVTGLLLLAVAGFTVYSFANRKPNAVFWGKIYVALVFLTNLFVLIGGATEETGLQSASQVVRSVIWGVIWFLYLTFSDQVQEIIPKSFRKISSTDWAMVAASVLLPVFLFVVGLAQINSLVDTRSNQEAELRNVSLSYNQRTDGRVIFTIPDGFECESQDVNSEGVNLTLFSLNNDEIGNVIGKYVFPKINISYIKKLLTEWMSL